MPNHCSEITLVARNLARRYGKAQAVRDVSLELKRGEVLGLLGHNGAGKSTTLQMLAGCLLPDHSENTSSYIEICGIDLLRKPVQAKAHLGYLPEYPPLYRELCVNDYLTFAARLRGIKRGNVGAALAQAMQRCGLDAVGKKTIGMLSRGYQQRVGIAQAIIHGPAVIVLDEPTVGLDPGQIRDIRALIRELGDAHSVILSTHLLGEVESVCDRVEIMQQGKLIYGDTSVHMQQYDSIPGFIIGLRKPPPLNVLAAVPGVTHAGQISPTQFRVLHAPDQNPKAALLTLAEQQGWELEQLTPLQATLEEVFVRITGAGNRNDPDDSKSTVRPEPVEGQVKKASAESVQASTDSARTGEQP